MKKSVWPIVIFFCFIGCEKSVNFRPANANPLLVVDARIESGRVPIVILSKSLNYFSTISPEILAGSFVHNATVFMDNGNVTHRLKEYSVTASAGYTLYYYSIDSSNLSTAFVGEFNRQYDLKIVAGAEEYHSHTGIPKLSKKIDSLWWKKAPDNPDTGKVVVMARVTDPPGYGNYIRYFTSVNDSIFYPGLSSVFDDQIVDGTTYDIQIEKGVDRNKKIDLENYSFFKRGDTVTVKFTNIDKATFDFWRTMEFNYQSIGNPFSSPTKVIGNVPGALGYFGGYAVQYKSIIVPR